MKTQAKAGSPRRAHATPDGVKRVFDDVSQVKDALTRLTQRSVPVDEIYVYVLDDEGRPEREVSIENESGALGGASLGAIVGAVVGLVLLLLDWTGKFGFLNHAVFGLDTAFGGFRAVAVFALAGVPIGAVFGLRSWNAHKKVSERKFRERSFLVVVDTEELSDVAHAVLDEKHGERLGAV